MVVDIHTHKANTKVQTIDTVGIHPWNASIGDLSAIEKRVAEVNAVGEIGLDFACDVPREVQEDILRAQLAIAERFKKPVILHCVRAFEEVMRVLQDYRLPAVIFHGFIGSTEQAQRAVKQRYYLSFGDRTFRSPKTIEAMRSTPLSQLFVESDESPTPIEQIYAHLAKLRGISPFQLIRAVEHNFEIIMENRFEVVG